MQKNVSSYVLTSQFIQKFKNVLIRHYGYAQYMDYLVVPSLLGKKTLAYIPLLNYTDRAHNEIDDLLELAKDNAFQIRTLNFEYKNFKQNDPVTMRIDVEGKTSENVFLKNVKPRCRNKIRNSKKKYDYRLEYGHSSSDIEAFYKIFSATMYKHGTPVLSKKLFYLLAEEFKDEIIFFNIYDKDEVAATMCIMLDEEIAWYPWGGVNILYSKKLAGYRIYWDVLEYICDNTDKKIFDFGRSPYGGPTYKFKSQFGALPVKIDIIASEQRDVYSKYYLASQVWKKLPKWLVDFVGPKLCKYLVDR